MKWTWTLLIATSLGLTACGDDEAGGGSGGLDEAHERLTPVVAASCNWVYDCCAAGESRLALGPFVEDAADCTGRVLDSLLSGNKSPAPALDVGPASELLFLARSLDLDRVELDQEALDACVQWLEDRACNEVPPEDPPEHCVPGEEQPDDDLCLLEDLFIGKAGAGDECNPSVNVECARGLICINFGADGVCARLAAQDETCFEDGECADPLICDYITGTCRKGSKAGEVCNYSDPDNPEPGTEKERCAAGLTCNPETLSCVEETCAPGSPCIVDYQCPEDYVCALNRCRQPGMAGDPCQRNDDCASEYCDPFNNVCVPKVADGGMCNDHDECNSGFCDGNTGLCAPTADNGQPCPTYYNEQCRTGYCDSSDPMAGPTCTGYAGPGGDCTAALCDPDPELNLLCWEMTCLELPFPNGITCASSSYCESEVCWMGMCEDGTPEGMPCALDGTIKECAKDLFCKVEDDLTGTGTCSPVQGPGNPCESDAECWGGCLVSYGELVCDTQTKPETIWCDAM